MKIDCQTKNSALTTGNRTYYILNGVKYQGKKADILKNKNRIITVFAWQISSNSGQRKTTTCFMA
jgi:hypothetical protein